MLKTLELIYDVLSNPANDKYAWIVADTAEIIVLQDFRRCRDSIPWKDLLLLLEGEIVNLPASKKQFSTAVVIKRDTPIFATSESRITYTGKFNSTDDRETEMMSVGWKFIEFTHQIAENEQKQVAPCGRCFAELTFLGETLDI